MGFCINGGADPLVRALGAKIRPIPRDEFHPTRLCRPPRRQMFRAGRVRQRESIWIDPLGAIHLGVASLRAGDGTPGDHAALPTTPFGANCEVTGRGIDLS